MQRTLGFDGLEPIAAIEPDPIVCAGCGEETCHPVEIDGESYCEDCTVKCEKCDCDVYSEDAKKTDCVDYYCEDCYNDLYSSCERCGCEVCNEDVQSSDHGDSYCEDCYNDIYCHCEHCGDEVCNDRAACNEDGESFCQDCYNDLYNHCDSCGCEISSDESYHTDDNTYCESCYSDHRSDSGEWKEGHFHPYNPTYAKIRSQRKFGVELETSECPDYRELEGETVFGCKPDGSISGMEFVSPPLWGDEGISEIRKFTGRANRAGFKVDNSCGYHAHFNASDLSVEQLKSVAYAYYKTYEVWAAFVRSSRRSNHYCRAAEWGRADLAAIHDQSGWNNFVGSQDRYVWFNVAAYRGHKTFEVRLHTATLDGNKVCNWIAAHTRFIDWAKDKSFAQLDRKLGGDVKAKFKAISAVWDDTELTDYYAGRARKFGTNVGIYEIATA